MDQCAIMADERIQLLSLVHIVEHQTPFSAGGLFNVEKSTLTTIVGTILSYLVILVQFAVSDE